MRRTKPRKSGNKNAGLSKNKTKETPKTTENVPTENLGNKESTEFDLEADIAQLKPVTFTTISKQEPETMLNLKWDHKVNLMGEKVPKPMVHCCDTCQKPIIIYGRLLPCKHVFCLSCAKKDEKTCARCKQKVTRIEQTGLSSIFMCTHGGSTYDNKGCRRTYLSQRDLEAHINHRHKPTQNEDKTTDKKVWKTGSSSCVASASKSRDPRAIAITTAVDDDNKAANKDNKAGSHHSKITKIKETTKQSPANEASQQRPHPGQTLPSQVRHHSSSAGNVQSASSGGSGHHSQKKSSYKSRQQQQQQQQQHDQQKVSASQQDEESDVPALSSVVAPPAPHMQQLYPPGSSRQRPPSAYYAPTVQTHNLITVHLEGEKPDSIRDLYAMQQQMGGAVPSSANLSEYGSSFPPPPPAPPAMLRNDAVFNLPSQQPSFYPNQRPDFPNVPAGQYRLPPQLPQNIEQMPSQQQQQSFPTMEHWPQRFY